MKSLNQLFADMEKAIDDFEPYNADKKQAWKLASIAFLHGLDKQLRLATSKIHFNAGGIGVSGEATMYGRFLSGRMFTIQLSADFPGFWRTVSSFTDYTGGPNQHIPTESGNAIAEKIEAQLA